MSFEEGKKVGKMENETELSRKRTTHEKDMISLDKRVEIYEYRQPLQDNFRTNIDELPFSILGIVVIL